MISGLSFTLTQPAHVATRRSPDSFLQTRDHLPGWTVRGAFAAAWIRENGAPLASGSRRELFIRLFEGEVRFSPAFVDRPPHSLAVHGHKYTPGKACDFAEVDHAVVDFERPPGQVKKELYCSCGQSMVSRRGVPNPPATYRHTSVSIDNDGTARDGDLFTRENLRSGVRFTGHLIGPEDLLEQLLQLEQISVGGRRTTHGLTTVDRLAAPAHRPVIQVRPDKMLVLRLASPAVFVDDTGRPASAPSPVEIGQVLGCEVQVVRQWTRWEQIGGWHAASGLPKHRETVVSAGSTYLLKPADEVSPEARAALAERGVGLRRHEGFGHLCGPRPLAWLPGRREDSAESVKNELAWRVDGVVEGVRAWLDNPTKPRRQSLADRFVKNRPEVAVFLRQLTEERAHQALRYLDEEAGS